MINNWKWQLVRLLKSHIILISRNLKIDFRANLNVTVIGYHLDFVQAAKSTQQFFGILLNNQVNLSPYAIRSETLNNWTCTFLMVSYLWKHKKNTYIVIEKNNWIKFILLKSSVHYAFFLLHWIKYLRNIQKHSTGFEMTTILIFFPLHAI